MAQDHIRGHQSLLENVTSYFDRAAACTPFPKGLLDQIKACNSVYAFSFPVLRSVTQCRVAPTFQARRNGA